MKRNIVTLVAVFAFCRLSAQTVDTIAHHNMGPHSAQSSTFMEMSDGSLLGGILMADEYPFAALGYVLHKASRLDSQLAVTDTLFIPYEYLPWHLTAKDPQGKGNILAEYYNDNDNEGCALRIRKLGDDLALDTTETIVPLASFMGHCAGPILDPNGDIILAYYDYTHTYPADHFARIGTDGTIKYRVCNDTLKIESRLAKGFRVFSQSPLRYCLYGQFQQEVKDDTCRPQHPYVYCYMLDSLFNVTNLYVLPWETSLPHYVIFSMDASRTKLVGMEDGGFFVARSYSRPSLLVPYIEDDGVAVMKYDSDFNLLESRKFLSEPYTQYGNGAQSIGLERSKDGHIYFAYFTQGWYRPAQVSVVKMDQDLNIVWQRHCLEREVGRNFGMMEVLDDNSVAVMGINTLRTPTGYVDHTEAFYVIVHDDYDGMEEQGIIVRPYAYWPNPAQDELHLQYSPDVTPTQIELYDLQGRMVRSQRNGLERLDLQGLASGAYTMRVIMEDGKVFADKVVKE